jgi:hypothetical protein
VAHDVASCEPQDEQSDKETTETAAATATVTALGLFRVGGRWRSSLGSSLVAGWELVRRHRFHLGVHLFVGVDGEERALERVNRSHWDRQRGV